MLSKFFKELEKRPLLDGLLSRFNHLFAEDSSHIPRFSDKAFDALLVFLENGEASFQNVAVQAGVKWSASSQKVMLRNGLLRRGFLTPSCLWAYRQLRGSTDEIYQEFLSPEMGFMQILLLKETEPIQSIPFLIEHFLTRRDVPEELRAASRLCILRLLDSGVTQDELDDLRSRYPGIEILYQWRPGIPGRQYDLNTAGKPSTIDFHQLVRTVHDMKELSSLTRTVYLISLFFVPLSDREWRSLLLSRTDQLFFHRLLLSGVMEAYNGGFLLSSETTKQTVIKKFLYESYSLAKESVNRNRIERLREERERKVRSSELDRQALEMVSDGIICVDRTGLLYYTNPAAERILSENTPLRERLLGAGSLEEVLRRYSKESVLSRLRASTRDDDSTQIFGDRVVVKSGMKRFDVELGAQVMLIRDTTDQYLIDEEIGKLYRHELKAAIDVVGVGLDSAKLLFKEDRIEEGIEFLDKVEEKRTELFTMLEERIDFIRLHSDAFQIRPNTVNLNMVVDRCVGNYREAARCKGVSIASNHLHISPLHVRGEERFLIRALDNLIRNAVNFSDKGAEVTITMGIANQDAYVRVEDTGPGIPPENLGKVFQLGFTTGGSGRGLYLAKRIAAAHHGRIELVSKPGNGASFTFRLPLLTEA